MRSRAQSYLNTRGELIASGRVAATYADLVLKDGTRFYSTSTPGTVAR